MSSSCPEVLICESDFEVGEEYARLCDGLPGVGAVVSFVGRVRDLNASAPVSSLELQHYPGMTEKLIQQIIDQAKTDWSLDRVRVIHRVGILQPTDQIVFVGVASAHRGEAFAAAEFIMDYLKTKATFWKRESDGNNAKWLDMKDSDIVATQRWQK